MSDINFERERKGYSTEQVDSYVKMLQEHYAKLEEKTKDCQNQLNVLEEQKNQIKKSEDEQQERLQEGQNHILELKEEISQRDKKLTELNLSYEKSSGEYSRTESKIKELIREKEVRSTRSRNQDTKAVRKEIVSLERQLEEFHQQSNRMVLEKEMLAGSIDKLVQQIESLDPHPSKEGNAHGEDGFETLQNIFIRARQEADQSVEEYKQQTIQEVREIEEEGQRLIEEAKKEADRIRDEIRREQMKAVEEENARLIEDSKAFQKEKQQFLDQCAQIKQEAELEKAKMLKEAEAILEETNFRLSSAEGKGKKVVDRVQQLISSRKRLVGEGYETVLNNLQKTMAGIQEITEEMLK